MSSRRLLDRERWLASIPEDDIGRFLGFFGRGPWILYALCAVSFTYLALVLGGPSGRSAAGIGALVLGLAVLLLIVLPAPTPLPKGRTIALVLAVPIIVGVVTWQQPFHDHPPRYDTWELALCDLMLFCLVIRARYLGAWIGMLLMHVTVGLWSTLITGAPWYGLSFVYTQAFSLLAVTVFAIGLHHTARQIAAHRAAERERATFQVRQSAAGLGIEAELGVVRELAGSMLEEISAGHGPDRSAVRSLEAALRDLIRGRALMTEPLVTTLRVVRERGIDVSVLDDLGDRELSTAQRQEIATWAAAQIAHAHGAAMTLRLSFDDGMLTATLAADGVLAAEYPLPTGL